MSLPPAKPTVLVLPGFLGSRLGYPADYGHDEIWLDLLDVPLGRLRELALEPGRDPEIRAVGVIERYYRPLMHRLREAGFDAHYHPYDWRRDPVSLGRELARRVAALPTGPLNLVAHSYGGLVVRAALVLGMPRVHRAVLLGAPHGGAFGAVRALLGRGFTLRLAALADLRHSVGELAGIAATWPGLLAMLPCRHRFNGANFLDPKTWAGTGTQPDPALLAQAAAQRALLRGSVDRVFQIAGTGLKTPAGARREGGKIRFTASRLGDGTVAVRSVLLPGAPLWFVEEEHGALPGNPLVGSAVADLLARGDTTRLPRSWRLGPADPRPCHNNEPTRDALQKALCEYLADAPGAMLK
jgi:pimeloyl-ACP methyl ester carboxylesterase